jgi:hypothetical protein
MVEHHFPQALADAKPVLGSGGRLPSKKLDGWAFSRYRRA